MEDEEEPKEDPISQSPSDHLPIDQSASKEVDEEKSSSFGSRDGSPEFREDEDQAEVHPATEVVAH